MTTHRLRVRDIETLSPTLKRFILEVADNSELPPTGAGAHVRLTLQNDRHKWKNAYSITHAPEDRQHVSVIVRRVAESRGGSAFLHEAVKAGDTIEAATFGNLFPLLNIARKHVLVSGGIGITPFISYMGELNAKGLPFELHHFCRAEEAPIFEKLLSAYPVSNVFLYPQPDDCNIGDVLASQPLGTHLYTCGPQPFMDMILDTAHAKGWPRTKLHAESFGGAHAGGAPFIAVLQRSGIEVAVRDDQTLLEAIEEAGVEPVSLCRGGACGQCLTTVIEGEPDHRDHYLDEDERASNKSIMICVSRAKSSRIVLDL